VKDDDGKKKQLQYKIRTIHFVLSTNLHPGNIYFIGCLAENKFEYQIVERIDVYLFSLLLPPISIIRLRKQ
jgi:hypothetical protein